MGSSYFITYGGNRLTFPGTPGPVAWEFEHTMVVVDPLSNGYITMEFTTPGGDTITLDSQMSSASARVPVGSTASWTAYGYSGNESSHNVLTSLAMQGFSNSSSDIVLGTSLYQYAALTGHGSALLTATGFASTECDTVKFHKMTYGEGSTAYYCTVSASGLLPAFTGSWGTAAGRSMWIPEGSELGYSASSISGITYSIQTATTHAFDDTGIAWSHINPGTNMLFTGVVTGAASLRLGSGRQKIAYATGYNRVLGAAQGTASAAAWQPLCIITAFSSNLCSAGASNSYIAGSANAGLVYGFESSNTLGALKNSAGKWSNPTSGNTYKWSNRHFIANSAFFSGTFSGMRTKGPTGSNNATYVFYGRDPDGNSVSRVSGQFALPTASAKTATKTASGSYSTTTLGNEAFVIMSNTVAQRSSLCANCVGYWTASGRVQ